MQSVSSIHVYTRVFYGYTVYVKTILRKTIQTLNIVYVYYSSSLYIMHVAFVHSLQCLTSILRQCYGT